MRSPLPTSQFHRNLPSRISILSMCARGAHSVFIIYYLLSIIYFAPQGHSRPRWCTHPQHPGKLQQKTALLPPLICTFHSFPRGLSRALKTPHRGVFAPRYAKRGARAVLVPDGAPVRNVPGNRNKKTSLLPPLICTFHSFPRGLSRALKTPHRGVFAPRYAKRGARAVLVPDGVPVRNILGNRNKKTPRNFLRGVCFGAPSGTRTQDPLIKSQLLYQLS